MDTFTAFVEPVMGTRLSMQFRADDHAAAAAADELALGECNRLEAILSAFRDGSEWNRWRRREIDDPGPEIRELLALAAHWHEWSGGTFNPAAGVLRWRWQRAVAEQAVPSDAELADLAASIRVLPYRVVGDTVERLGNCRHLDLHAIAKGWVVDRAAAAAMTAPGVEVVLLNAGGDLLRLGPGEIEVRIEDPRTPFDNAPPMACVRLGEGGVATSSPSRRGLTIDGRHFHHVMDPRTGHPVEDVVSVTITAPTAVTADVMTTAVGVLTPAEAIAMSQRVPGVGCLLLDRHGELWRNEHWRSCDDDVQRVAM